MEKLELKHIAPYLPYGINAILLEQLNGSNRFQQTDCFVIGASEDYIYTDSFFDEVYYHEIKPILRPIEDLTELIEWQDGTYAMTDSEFFDLDDCDYNTVNDYIKRHFDVFSLIPRGLAIPYSDVQSSLNEG